MTEKQFYKELMGALEVPFDIADVTNVEAGLSGCAYVDLKDGTTYSLTFTETEGGDDA